jgi:putative ABC transport system ATP-binding protein
MDMLHTLHDHGATIVMVTHSHHDAAQAERIIHMLDGKVVSKPAEELIEEAALA